MEGEGSSKANKLLKKRRVRMRMAIVLEKRGQDIGDDQFIFK